MSDLPNALPTILRNAREARGWSRRTLAGESGTSEAAIARTELYGDLPRLATLAAWAKALGMAPGDMLGRRDLALEHGACANCTTETRQVWHNGEPCPAETGDAA